MHFLKGAFVHPLVKEWMSAETCDCVWHCITEEQRKRIVRWLYYWPTPTIVKANNKSKYAVYKLSGKDTVDCSQIKDIIILFFFSSKVS